MEELELLRVLGPEFAAVPDETVTAWLEIVRPLVSRERFGSLYAQALCLLACHRMKKAGLGEDNSGLSAVAGLGLTVESVSEGGSSIRFSSAGIQGQTGQEELRATGYGQAYLQLRRSVIVPIRCGGEGMP